MRRSIDNKAPSRRGKAPSRSKKKHSIQNTRDISIRKKLIAITKSIRKKHSKLQRARRMEEIHNEKLAIPFVEPITKLLRAKVEVKAEPNTMKFESTNNNVGIGKDDDDGDEVFLPAQVHFTPDRNIRTEEKSGPNFLNNEDVFEHSADNEEQSPERILAKSRSSFIEVDERNPEILQEFLSAYHEIPRSYLRDLMRNDTSDNTYGVFYDIDNDKFSLGNTILKINNNDPDIYLKDKRFAGTTGLYELLFKKSPIGYTKTDLKNYITMLDLTSAHKLKNDPTGRVKGCNSRKYQEIIKPGLEKYATPVRRRIHTAGADVEGSGASSIGLLGVVDNKKFKYIYFDDPNELVERLKVLLASRDVGNNSHNNEINSLLTQLRQLDLIS